MRKKSEWLLTSLILEAVQSGTTVSDLIDVLPHDSDGIVDLLNLSSSAKAPNIRRAHRKVS